MPKPKRELGADEAGADQPAFHGGVEAGGDAAGELDAERGAEAEQEGEPDREHDPEPIRLGHRVFLVGDTGTGKSEALMHLFAIYGGQRLLLDVNDHLELGPDALAEEPPPLRVDDPARIDWSHRTIHYVPKRPGDRHEMNRLHAAIFRRGRIFVACDEAEDVAPSMGGGSGMYVRRTLKQGRKYRITYGAATQRPVGVDRSVINQAEHLFCFRMSDRDDLNVLTSRLGMSVHELAATLNQLGEHEYLRHTKGVSDEHGRPLVLHMPALPAATVEQTRRHVINPEHSA